MTAPVSGRPAPGPTGAGTAAVAGLAGSAALVAALTLAARLVGFGRVFAFSATVGAGCTGDAYAAANQLPNVLFEVVAGGALAGAVVPAVAAAMARGGAGEAGRVASALLSWSLLVLTPVALLLAAVAGPLTGLFLRDPTCGGFGDVATRMLVVFAPQVPLYGIGIVLGGVLQAHHRFAGPALAPLLSSAVVIAAYLAYAALAGPAHGAVGFVPSRGAELMLAGGTTLGVVALSLPLLVPVRRAGVRLRPTLRFPPGTAAGVRALATAGVAALLAQQAAVVVVLAVTTRIGGVGAINVYQQYGQAVYLLPYAVLAVPVATAAFPRLARQAADGDRAAFARTSAVATRGLLVASVLGAGMLVAAAPAAQRLFTGLDAVGGPALASLADGVTALAVGLPGWALVALGGRALYALGRGRAAATATATGWLVVVGASLVAVAALRAAGQGRDRAAVVGLGLGNSAGMCVAGVLLLLALRRAAGPEALAGVGRTFLRTAAAALAGAVAGRLVADVVLRALPRGVVLPPVAAAAAGAGVVLVVVGAVVAATEPAAVASVLRRGGRGAARGAEPPVGGAARGAEPPVGVLLVLATSGGGTGRHVAELARGLSVSSARVTVAGPRATLAALDLPGEADAAAVEVSVRPRPVADAVAVRRLRALARDVDVVHAHGVRAGALAVLATRALRRRPAVVVTAHNAAVGGRRVRALHGLLTSVVARGADAVLGVSGDLVTDLRAHGATDAARALVPAPPTRPATRTREQVRAELGVPNGVALLVTVARLAPQKGLDVLAEAVRRLEGDGGAGRTGGVVAVVAGDGPLEPALRDGPLRLLGVRRDVPDLLGAADVVVVPSRWEGQPLVVQEALRAGAAVVATDAGGTREVTGDAARLVPPGDAAALAGAIEGLLRDPRALAALREAAAARARTLPTAQDALAQVTALYARLLAARRAPTGGARRSG